ncbi:hypothetical protein D3C87_893880 [compost metagenome]
MNVAETTLSRAGSLLQGKVFQFGMGGGLETQWVLDHHVDTVNVITGLRLVGPV